MNERTKKNGEEKRKNVKTRRYWLLVATHDHRHEDDERTRTITNEFRSLN